MKDLLETLIKEKGLWKEELPIPENLRVTDFEDGVFAIYENNYEVLRKNIWHIDTLREICKAKWGDKEVWSGDNYSGKPYVGSKGLPMGKSWELHMYKLIYLESPQEREKYLLSN